MGGWDRDFGFEISDYRFKPGAPPVEKSAIFNLKSAMSSSSDLPLSRRLTHH